MSGFEVAGIVLGTFPIALEALEKYREMAKVWGFWWEIRYPYQKCKCELKFHHLSLNRNLKQLLLPLVAEDEQIQRLLADPGGEEWQQQSIAKQLEDRLQESHDLYLEIIQQLRRTMDEIKKELAIDKAGFQEKVSRSKDKSPNKQSNPPKALRKNPFTKANSEYEIYRLKFSLGEAKREALFSELKDYNERLEKLLTTSDVMKDLETKRNSLQKATKRATDKAIGYFWRHADQLYNALYRAWNCSCSNQHQAKMLLQHRTSFDTQFVMLFLYHSNNGTDVSTAWSSHEAKIKMLDLPTQGHDLTPISHSSTPNPRTTQATKSDPSTQEDRMTTKRKMNSPPMITITAVDEDSERGVSQQGVKYDDGDKIVSLCRSFTTKECTPCRGFLQADDKRYYIYSVTSNNNLKFRTDDSVTLSDLLCHNYGPPLSRRQRYSLALILASSFLQLRDSAWLISTWDSNDISFFRDATDAKAIMLDRPYVTRDFTGTTAAGKNRADAASSFVSLGIALLQLCFGILIKDHPSRLRYPPGDEQTRASLDLLAAIDWSREVGEEAGPDYAVAVQWCLLDSRSMTDKEEWRRKLFQNVVSPLERCHTYLNYGV